MAAGMGIYVAGSLFVIFFWAEPFAVGVVQSSGFDIHVAFVAWMFRIAVFLNLLAVLWGVLKIIGIQEGEWPN